MSLRTSESQFLPLANESFCVAGGRDSLMFKPAEVCWMKRCSNPTLKFFISGTLLTTSS